jgi:uncharacterized membrane protein YcaP (DUF421 family)
MDDYTFDLRRIFFGDLPLLFFAEIALRTAILYLYTLFILRTLGKRSAGELTVVDVAVIVALGSSVGDPMFYPHVPVLHGIVAITLVVGLQRIGLFWANRVDKVDELLKGKPALVVLDGTLNLDGLEHASVSKREIFQIARQSGYRNLGEIQRMYIETDDQPSIFGFKPDQVRPGLQFEPPWEMNNRTTIEAGSTLEEPTVLACVNCGHTGEFKGSENIPSCPRCKETTWSIAE